MNDPKSSQEITESAAKLPDLEPEAQELGIEDAENVRGGIIVQGGIAPYQKVVFTDSIQSTSWKVTG